MMGSLQQNTSLATHFGLWKSLMYVFKSKGWSVPAGLNPGGDTSLYDGPYKYVRRLRPLFHALLAAP